MTHENLPPAGNKEIPKLGKTFSWVCLCDNLLVHIVEIIQLCGSLVLKQDIQIDSDSRITPVLNQVMFQIDSASISTVQTSPLLLMPPELD